MVKENLLTVHILDYKFLYNSNKHFCEIVQKAGVKHTNYSQISKRQITLKKKGKKSVFKILNPLYTSSLIDEDDEEKEQEF